MPKVSVVIPVYNAEKYLRQCLDSVVNQTLKDIEIICIDDCSTDNSLKILKEYALKDDRFIIIEQKTNQGQGVARNIALDIAKSDYIMFLDSDDWFEINACEEAYNCISRNNTDICFFSYFKYYEKNQTEEAIDRISIFGADDINKFSLKDVETPYMQSAWVWLQMYNAQFVKKHNIKFSETSNCEDAPFAFKAMAFSDNVSAVNKPLYHHRKFFEGLKLVPERIGSWKEIFENKISIYNFIMDLPNRNNFIKPYLIYVINTTFNRYIPYTTIAKDRKLKNEMYNVAHNFAKLLKNNHNINEIKQYIAYSDFIDFAEAKTSVEYDIRRFFSRIFSVRQNKKYNTITILGIKINKKRKQDAKG